MQSLPVVKVVQSLYEDAPPTIVPLGPCRLPLNISVEVNLLMYSSESETDTPRRLIFETVVVASPVFVMRKAAEWFVPEDSTKICIFETVSASCLLLV